MKNVSGLDELDAALKSLSIEIAGTGLVELTDSAASVVLPEIELRVPQRSGNLMAALESVSKHGNNHASTTIQVADSAPGGENHYAIFEEFGTSKNPAHSFMRAGFEAAKNAAEQAAANKLIEIIQRKS
jgi:HK97 gp10 family phage protein